MTAVKYQTMPPLSTDEYAQLEQSILADGVQVPIIVDDAGVVIDGHHRKRIAEQHGLHCPREVRSMLTEAQKMSLSIQLNIARRQLNREQKRAIIEASVKAQPEKSNREHARQLGVDHKTVQAVRVEAEGSGEIPHFERREDPRSGNLSQIAVRPVQVDGFTVDQNTGEIIDGPTITGEPVATEHTVTEKVRTITGLDGKEYKRPEPSAPRDPKPVLAGSAAEQHNADTNCEVTGKALITFDAYTYPSHRSRMLNTWWPMGKDNIQPMHAALFNPRDIRRIAAGLMNLADEMEAHNEYN